MNLLHMSVRPLIHQRSSRIGHREWIIEHVNEQELRALFSLDPIHRRSSRIGNRARVPDTDVHVNVRNWNSINHVHVNVSERSLFIWERTFVWKSSKRNAWVIVSNSWNVRRERCTMNDMFFLTIIVHRESSTRARFPILDDRWCIKGLSPQTQDASCLSSAKLDALLELN